MNYDFGNGTKVVSNGWYIEVFKKGVKTASIQCVTEEELEDTFDEQVEIILEEGY